MDPELHREVGDGPADLGGVLLEPGRLGAVLVEGGDRLLVDPLELGVREQPHPLLGLDVDQELYRVVVPPPGHRVDATEEPLGDGRPAPPVVVGNVPKPLERGRQLDVGGRQRADVVELTRRIHRTLVGESPPRAARVGWLGKGIIARPAQAGRGFHEPLDPDSAIPLHRGELDSRAPRGLQAHHGPGAPDVPHAREVEGQPQVVSDLERKDGLEEQPVDAQVEGSAAERLSLAPAPPRPRNSPGNARPSGRERGPAVSAGRPIRRRVAAGSTAFTPASRSSTKDQPELGGAEPGDGDPAGQGLLAEGGGQRRRPGQGGIHEDDVAPSPPASRA